MNTLEYRIINTTTITTAVYIIIGSFHSIHLLNTFFYSIFDEKDAAMILIILIMLLKTT